MGELYDIYAITDHLTGIHKYVGAGYTVHMYDILMSAQPDCPPNANPFLEYNASVFGLDDYPIYDETKRKELNDVIISHFLMHEIGFETEFLFRIKLRAKMFAIMPGYNAMLSAIAEMNKRQDFANTSMSETTHDETRTNDTVTKNRFSDTPQQNLENIAIEQGTEWIDKYLTSGSVMNDKGNGTMNYTHKDGGRNVSYGKIVDELSTKKFAVYDRICEDLNDLFLGLFL